MKVEIIRALSSTLIIVVGLNGPAFSQQCETTLDCAQQMIDQTNELKRENEELRKKILSLVAETKRLNDGLIAQDEKIDTIAAQGYELKTNYVERGQYNGNTIECPSGYTYIGPNKASDHGGFCVGLFEKTK